MFANIEHIQIVAACAAVVVLAYIGLVQYSRYVAHKKKHVNDESTSELPNNFAVIPYALIPIMFGAAAVFVGLVVADYVAFRGWVDGVSGALIASVIFSIVLYIVMDAGLIRHVGDAVYFDTIESKFLGVAADAVDDVDAVDIRKVVAEALTDLLKK